MKFALVFLLIAVAHAGRMPMGRMFEKTEIGPRCVLVHGEEKIYCEPTRGSEESFSCDTKTTWEGPKDRLVFGITVFPGTGMKYRVVPNLMEDEMIEGMNYMYLNGSYVDVTGKTRFFSLYNDESLDCRGIQVLDAVCYKRVCDLFSSAPRTPIMVEGETSPLELLGTLVITEDLEERASSETPGLKGVDCVYLYKQNKMICDTKDGIFECEMEVNWEGDYSWYAFALGRFYGENGDMRIRAVPSYVDRNDEIKWLAGMHDKNYFSLFYSKSMGYEGMRFTDKKCYKKFTSYLESTGFRANIEGEQPFDVLGRFIVSEELPKYDMESRSVEEPVFLPRCLYIHDRRIISCEETPISPQFKCDTEVNWEGESDFSEFTVGKFQGSDETMNNLTRFLVLAKSKDGEWINNTYVDDMGVENMMSIYFSEEYGYKGLRIKDKTCFKRFCDMLEKVHFEEKVLIKNMDTPFVRSMSFSALEKLTEIDAAKFEKVECHYVHADEVFACAGNGTAVECKTESNFEKDLPFPFFGIGLMPKPLTVLNETIYRIAPRDISDSTYLSGSYLTEEGETRYFSLFTNKKSECKGIRIVERQCFDRLSELIEFSPRRERVYVYEEDEVFTVYADLFAVEELPKKDMLEPELFNLDM